MQINKVCVFLITIFLYSIPLHTFAAWEVSSSGTTPVTPREPFFQSKVTPPLHRQVIAYRPVPYRPRPASMPVPVPVVAPAMVTRAAVFPTPSNPSRFVSLGRPQGMYAVSISGSLKENLERIMSRYHWRVVWKAIGL